MYVSKEENSRLTHCFSVLLCLLASSCLVSFLASKKRNPLRNQKYRQTQTLLEFEEHKKSVQNLDFTRFQTVLDNLSAEREVCEPNLLSMFISEYYVFFDQRGNQMETRRRSKENLTFSQFPLADAKLANLPEFSTSNRQLKSCLKTNFHHIKFYKNNDFFGNVRHCLKSEISLAIWQWVYIYHCQLPNHDFTLLP